MVQQLFTEYGVSELALMAGVRPPSVSGWRGAGVPKERCPAIERGTSGRYQCEQLRPDVRWVRIPDPDWRWHADGRPCIDVAAMQVAAAPEQKAA